MHLKSIWLCEIKQGGEAYGKTGFPLFSIGFVSLFSSGLSVLLSIPVIGCFNPQRSPQC